jgi:hypothetical protein
VATSGCSASNRLVLAHVGAAGRFNQALELY